jgi:phosphate transport system permease protein
VAEQQVFAASVPIVQKERRGRFADQTARVVFLACAVLMILIIIGVFVFIGINGFRVFGLDSHARNFFTSSNWDPQGLNGTPSYGALGFIIGSVVTTLLSVIIVTPLAFGMALFMTEVSPKWLENILRPLLEVFTGMPSVVIGFLGLVILIPFISKVIGPHTPNPATAGEGWAAATLVLIIMILPTVISISIDALRAVPSTVREASLALGSTRWQMMKNAVIPAATTGLATAVVMGMARAIGEALAVSMVLQGTTLPTNWYTALGWFQPNVNLTQPIVLNFQEATGAERDAYFFIGFILLVISFIFVAISRYLASRSVYK